MPRPQPKYDIENFIKDCQDPKNIELEYGVLASASRDFDLQTRKELLEFISKGRMESLEFVNSIPYRKSSDIPPPFCDAFTFTSGYSSGYISIFASKGSKKWVIKSFHRSNEFDNSLAFALEKAGLLFRNRKKGGNNGN